MSRQLKEATIKVFSDVPQLVEFCELVDTRRPPKPYTSTAGGARDQVRRLMIWQQQPVMPAAVLITSTRYLANDGDVSQFLWVPQKGGDLPLSAFRSWRPVTIYWPTKKWVIIWASDSVTWPPR